MNGCCRAKESIISGEHGVFNDYSDGDLFKRLKGTRMRQWNRDMSIYIFLWVSSDGGEIFNVRENRNDVCTLAFIVLNYEFELRCRVRNVLIPSFVRGSHHVSQFDTFLGVLVEYLKNLESGITVNYFDGREWTVYSFIHFVTGAWACASKLLGMVGHTSKYPCRRCAKQAVYVPCINGLATLPTFNETCRTKLINWTCRVSVNMFHLNAPILELRLPYKLFGKIYHEENVTGEETNRRNLLLTLVE